MNSVIWAHRGASAYFPENTIPSFEGAKAMKADGVELDVHATADGKIVVSHDGNLKRCGGVNLEIASSTYDEIRKFPVPAGFAEFPNVRVPLLSDVFELLSGTGMTVNVEIKSGWEYDNIVKLVKLTHDMRMHGQVLYSSFDHTALYIVRALDSGCRLGALYGTRTIPAAGKYAKALGLTELHPHYSVCSAPGFVSDAAEYGVNVNPWTVNDEETVAELIRCGCHGIITNCPDMAKQVRDRLAKA